MQNEVIIAVDGMGGDGGAAVAMAGIDIVRSRYDFVRFVICGRADVIEPLLEAYPLVAAVSEFHPYDTAISMDEKPALALRQGRRVSSMWGCIDAVKSGAAHAAISAGNTGALMAMAKIILRTLPGIDRPAIAGIWPTLQGKCVVLDLGATVDVSVSQIAQLAVMGCAYAQNIFGTKSPRVGILNIGVEDVKGTDNVREAASVLSTADMNFIGFVEGDGIGRGDADVIVTDGFTGNIALKTAEGTARQFGEYLREALGRNLMSKIGYFFLRKSIAQFRTRVDPNVFNGGMFLGLKGIVVKSHGGANASGFAYAIEVAIESVRSDMATHICADVEKMQNLLDTAWAETLD